MPALISRKAAPVITMERKPFSSAAPVVAPSTSPRVHFASTASIVTGVSRPLEPKEAWSLYHFETHARSCIHCHDPYAKYKAGRRLCPDGDALAQDMNVHVCMRDGEVFERFSNGLKPSRVEVTHGYEQVRGQLKAFERREKRRSRTSAAFSTQRSEERYRGEGYRREAVYVKPHRTEMIVEPARAADREGKERRKEKYSPVIDYHPRREVKREEKRGHAPVLEYQPRRETRREEKREERREEKAYRHDSRRDSGYAPTTAAEVNVNVNGKGYRTEIRVPQTAGRADYSERRKSYYI